MVIQIVENAVLIILFLLITTYLYNKSSHKWTLTQKIGIGFLQGLFGIIFIFFGVEVEENVLLDFRQLSLIHASFYGGYPAVIITSMVLSIYRLFFVNGIQFVSIVGAISILVIGLGLGFIASRTHYIPLKWMLLMVYSLLIGNLTFLLVLKSHFSILPYFSVVIIFGCLLSAFAHYVFHFMKIRIGLNQSTSTLLQTYRNSDIEQIYETTLKELTDLVNVEYASIVLTNGKQHNILCILENGQYQLTNYNVKKGEVEVLDRTDLTTTTYFPNWNKSRPMGELEHRFYDEGVRSSICVPILYQSEVIAFINLASKSPYHFTKTEMTVINQIVPLLCFGLSLNNSESKFNTVTQSTHDAIILADQHMLITFWNKGAEYIFGYSREEAVGKNVDLVIPNHFKEAHRRGVETYHPKQTSNVIGKTLELQGVCKNGRTIPIELTVNHWEMGGMFFYSSIIRDISERKRVEIALKESEERYRKLIELSPDGLCVYQNKAIIYANEKSASMIGLRMSSELIGLESLEFLPKDQHEMVQRIIEKLYLTEESFSHFEVPIMRMDGEEIVVEVSASLIHYNGQPAILATFRDISERKKIERKLTEANEILERLSNIDGLTGIPNRRHFDTRLEKEWNIASNKTSPISVLLCDIDYFKAYNDNYGHLAGDQCLTEIAKSFGQVLIRPRDFAARYGGEEFVILLPDTKIETAIHIAECIRLYVESLQIPHMSSKVSNWVTMSIGVATMIPYPLVFPAQLLDFTDKALYKAKQNGKNRVEFHKD